MNPLDEIRQKIAYFDRELLDILRQRFALCQEAAKIKQASGVPIHDQEYEEQLRSKIADIAQDFGLNQDWTQSVFTKILQESKRLQQMSLDGLL